MRPHQIVTFGNSLTIDEMYFRMDEIRFVDVVKQSYPVIRHLLVIWAVCSALIALLFVSSFPGVTAFFAICSMVETAIVCMISRRYALRIGQQFGTAKVIISTDRKELEEIRIQVEEALRKRMEQP